MRLPASGRSAVALVAADVGMKLSYTPLLAILLPMRMEALGRTDGVTAFSLATLAGAVVASVANVTIGVLSDRWRGRVDRRAWLFAGLVALAASYAGMAAAQSLVALAAALIGLQVAVNLIMSPLTAMIAERYLRRPAGLAAGAAGMAQPLANLLGAGLVASLVAFGPAPYIAIAAACAALILPFVRTAPEIATAPPVVPDTRAPQDARPATGGLGWLWAWRFGLALSATLSGPYLVFRLAAEQGIGAAHAAVKVSELTAFASIMHMTAALATARAVARGLDRRLGAWLSAGAWVGAMVAFLFAGRGVALVGAFTLLGVANGVQQASDAQLWLGLLPARRSLGRDLGLLNLAYTLPQMLAPALALATPGVARGDVAGLFAIAAISAAAAGLAAIPLGEPGEPGAPAHRRRAPPERAASRGL